MKTKSGVHLMEGKIKILKGNDKRVPSWHRSFLKQYTSTRKLKGVRKFDYVLTIKHTILLSLTNTP